MGWARATSGRLRTLQRKRAAPPGPPFFVRWLKGSGRLGQRRLRLRDDRGEDAAFVHREVGHDLAVEFDPGELHAVHELRIGQAFGANRGVDALDPPGSERTLLNLSVWIIIRRAYGRERRL